MCFLKYSETCAAMQYFGSTKRCDNGNHRDDNVVVANNNVAHNIHQGDLSQTKCAEENAPVYRFVATF